MQAHPSFTRNHDPILTYADLRGRIREDLLSQHPEWVDAQGQSALCEVYEARFAWLLEIFSQQSPSKN